MSTTNSATEIDDPALQALEQLAEVLRQNAVDSKLLAERLEAVCESRRQGTPWNVTLANEPQPATVQLVSTVLGRLSAASGAMRKSLILALREEGESIPSIARMFGVTHQRVSNVIRHTTSNGSTAG
jgi:hypothetical protein